ncbi:MAG: hypothetical protein U9Q88_13195 [Bacillota bacterium]|nr:hypothetical protein [Bacillota bacterium]
MNEGELFFLNTPDPNRPVELKYLAEFDKNHKWFEKQEDALLYLFDNGIKKYKYLTKELDKYKSLKNLLTYELWHLENRVGYVTYGDEQYYDENEKLEKRKSYIWRFIGHGRSCFAQTPEALKDKVLSHINHYKEDTEDRGYNTYPYYTKYYR